MIQIIWQDFVSMTTEPVDGKRLVFAHGLQTLLHRRAQQATATVDPAPTPVVEAAPPMAEPANVSTFPSSQHGPLF